MYSKISRVARDYLRLKIVYMQYHCSRGAVAMQRFTIDIDEKFNQTLTALANGGSKAEVIRKAVATYSYLKQEVPGMDTDKRLSITDAAGNVKKDVILP
jgi:hypothetical protein